MSQYRSRQGCYRRTLIPGVLLLATALLPPQVRAWGYEGHRLVCGIAESYLTTKGKSFLKKVSARGQYLKGGELSFPESCVWPDEVKYSSRKDTYDYHFLNVDPGALDVDLSRDCPGLSCLPVGIQRSLNYLQLTPGSKREKGRQAAALRYLGHYIGDLHQPLHISHQQDWGGNKIKVLWFGKETNLHSVWDSKILDRIGLNHPRSIGFMLAKEVDPGEIDIMRWVHESLVKARHDAYRHRDGSMIKMGDSLADQYFSTNKPIVIQQLVLAGRRLAMIINTIATGESVSFLRATPSEP